MKPNEYANSNTKKDKPRCNEADSGHQSKCKQKQPINIRKWKSKNHIPIPCGQYKKLIIKGRKAEGLYIKSMRH